MESKETKPDATPPWRSLGTGTSAWTERGDRRGLPTPPPRPRCSPPARAANDLRGEGRGSSVQAREEVKGAAAGNTVRREAGRNAAAAAEHGVRAQEAAGSAEATEERRTDAAQRKRSLPPPEQQPRKRMKVHAGTQDPPDCCKLLTVPLGRNRNPDDSRHRAASAADGGGPGARGKAAPRPPLPRTKDGVLPRAPGTSLLNNVPAAGSMAGSDRHGGDTRVDALRHSGMPAADDLPDTGSHSQGAAGSLVYSRARSAGTGELQRKKNGFSVKPPVVSAALLRRTSNARSPLGCLGRGSRDTRLPSKDVSADGCSSGTSCDVVANSSAQGPSKEHRKSKRGSETSRMNRASSDVPPRMCSQSTTTRDKIVRALVNPAKPSEKSMVKEKETTNENADTEKPTADGFMDKRLIAQENEPARNKVSSDPKEGEDKASDDLLIDFVDSMEKLESKVVFNLKDDDVLKAAALSGGRLKLYTPDPDCPSLGHQGQLEICNADARSKFKMICRRFEFLCRVLVRAVGQPPLSLNGAGGRNVNIAYKAMKEMPDFSKHGAIVGEVPGVEVGDQFLYRPQLAIVGLHRWFFGGIDWTNDENGIPLALSIVCSGGYPDEVFYSGELVYTGSGGRLAGNEDCGDQELKRGNLGLKNCITTGTPVRVIYGLTSDNVERRSQSRAKKISGYTYDGLYHVVHFCEEGEQGSIMFKYRLKKIPGQPELPLHLVKKIMSRKRNDVLMDDISGGKENTPICLINTFGEEPPEYFSYITGIKSATKAHPQGCGCTKGCSDSDSCSCARKNGGKLPYNSNGALVSESSLVIECGPSCKCPSSCRNRVSQHGIQIPLEIFRTNTGWGVRSLWSISSGSFVCEYTGELRHSMEADQTNTSGYLFNIGHSKESQLVSGQNSSGTCPDSMDDVGFTIDATKFGNVGRFINLSCSPNLFAQNVLWDHGDKRVPHIMFFAMETIPPLQELTCRY